MTDGDTRYARVDGGESYLRTDAGAGAQTVADAVTFDGGTTVPETATATFGVGSGVGKFYTGSNPTGSGGGYLEYQKLIGDNAVQITAAGAANLDLFQIAATTSNFSGDMTVTGSVTAPNVNQAQVFTASGTFTVPTGVARVFVQLWGGGGGNGNYPGGGGGYADGWVEVSAGQNITVTVGAAGLGGWNFSTNDNQVATSGGASSFGSYIVATGGAVGNTSGVAAAGGVGTNGIMLASGGNGSTSSTGSGGNGATSFGGAGGGENVAGSVPGGGAGGAGNLGNERGGARGEVRIYY